MPKKAPASSPRPATTAGMPGRARTVPRGSSRRRPAASARAPTRARPTAARSSRWAAYCRAAMPAPASRAQGALLRRPPAAGRASVRTVGTGAEQQGQARAHERQQEQEDAAPAEVGGHQAGGERADQRGQHPPGREGAEEPGAQLGGVRLPGDDVEQHDDDAGAQALHRPAEDQHGHVLGDPGDQQAGGEHRDAREHPGPGRPAVAHLSPDDHADDGGDEEGAEGPGVPGDAVELGDGAGHRRPDGHRLEGDERDEGQQADRRPPVAGVPDARRDGPLHERPNPWPAALLPGPRKASSAGPRDGDRRSTCGACGCAYFRALICSVACGTTVLRSPMTPKSASSKIGASGSLLMATMVFEVCMPARCWIAPEMPTAT